MLGPKVLDEVLEVVGKNREDFGAKMKAGVGLEIDVPG